MLISGPVRLSRKTARQCAKYMLCTTGADNCGCASCAAFDAGNHPDFFEFKEGEKVGIDDMREHLRVTDKPAIAKRKVVYIPDFGSLTDEAQNAVLKILEDFPDRIALAAAFSSGRVIETVKSRLVCVNCPLLSIDDYRRLYPEADEGDYLVGGGDEVAPDKTLRSVYDALKEKSARKFLEALHSFREGDKEDFFTVRKRNGMREFLAFLSRYAVSEQKFSALKRIGEEESRSASASYGRAEYGCFVIEAADMIERGEL